MPLKAAAQSMKKLDRAASEGAVEAISRAHPSLTVRARICAIFVGGEGSNRVCKLFSDHVMLNRA
ncbi:MAG: hypothetical protein DMG06_06745 [Acidobacteria bacterium]|nr:MAG: hypothetical protein DMG06_06745 [Acidobacteriota bacterium]